MTVVGRRQPPAQTKQSARSDKRPSSVYCMAQKHLLVGASLSTVCLYCVKHLLAYFQKHLLAYFRKHLSLVCALSLPPSPTQEGEEVGKGLVGAIEVVQTSECSNKLSLQKILYRSSIHLYRTLYDPIDFC